MREAQSAGIVPSRMARHRAREATAILVTASSALTLAPIALVRVAGPGFRELWWLVILGGLLPIVAPLQCIELSRQAPTTKVNSGRVLLTALTPTGWRTVELNELVSISLFTMPGRFGPGVVMLIVTDSNGVRIGLRSGQAWGALRRTLSANGSAHTNTPRLSRRATRLIQGGATSVWSDALLPLALAVGWFAGIVALAAFVATG